MEVTYDIIRVDGGIEVTEEVPQSDFDLIKEAEKMEWGQIACRHMEDEAESNWARDRIHSMMVRGYRREESRCGCL